jgi:hypothetical protein
MRRIDIVEQERLIFLAQQMDFRFWHRLRQLTQNGIDGVAPERLAEYPPHWVSAIRRGELPYDPPPMRADAASQ